MGAVVVRIRDNKEQVGVFVYRSYMELFWLIDECLDPNQVEFLEIKSGGVFFPNYDADKFYIWDEIKNVDFEKEPDYGVGSNNLAQLTESLKMMDKEDVTKTKNGWQNFDDFSGNVRCRNKKWHKKYGVSV